MELILSIVIGISLSATSGFRIFVPLLFLSGASLAGWVELTPTFDWISSYPAFYAFLIATILEAAAYLIPYIDNLLNAIATPVSVVAGVIITASVIIDLHPMLAWTLAVIAGGGAALGGSVVSGTVHAGSTAVTGGVANPVLSFIESVTAAIISFLTVLAPVFALLVLILIITIVIRKAEVYQNHRSKLNC